MVGHQFTTRYSFLMVKVTTSPPRPSRRQFTSSHCFYLLIKKLLNTKARSQLLGDAGKVNVVLLFTLVLKTVLYHNRYRVSTFSKSLLHIFIHSLIWGRGNIFVGVESPGRLGQNPRSMFKYIQDLEQGTQLFSSLTFSCKKMRIIIVYISVLITRQ